MRIYLSLFILILSINTFGQYAFDIVVNTSHPNVENFLNQGYGSIELENSYLIYGSNLENYPDTAPMATVDSTRASLLLLDREGYVLDIPRIENNSCNFECKQYVEAHNGNFIGVGNSLTQGDTCAFGSFSNRPRLYMHEINSLGQIVWQKNLGDTIVGGVSMGAADIAQTDDNGYMILGVKNQNTVLLKINDTGDSLWTKTIADSWRDYYQIERDGDGFMIFLSTGSILNVIKTDANGDSLWHRTINVYPSDITPCSLGGYAIVSEANQPPLIRTKITKIDSDSNIIWESTIDSLWAYGSITETNTGEFAIVNRDFALLNSVGELIWKRTFSTNPFTFYLGVISTSDNGFLITGRTNDLKTIVLKTDCSGNLVWNDSLCHRYDHSEIIVFPNPSIETVYIQMPNDISFTETTLYLYDYTGRLIHVDWFYENGIYSINTSSLESGHYLFKVQIDNQIYDSGKFSIIH